jgi:hypothetical protein
MKLRLFASVAAIGLASALSLPAGAQQTAPAPAAAPSTAMDLGYGISMSGHVEVGTSINPDSPRNNINFGQTFTDQANTVRMNQALLNIERDLDPKIADFQWGFKFTGMYGTDSRVTHFMNEFDRVTNSPYQWDIVELDAQFHAPTIGGGTDIKVGQYPTPLGYEVIDATGNPFYSHSYIFNFGLPFKHTGLLTTTHVSDMLDLWLGIDTGVNNSIGAKGMANNEFPKALFGFGLNGLMGGKLTILGLAHVGPENPGTLQFPPFGVVANPGANSHVRDYVDFVTTYKIDDSWTTVNEINLIHDDLAHATGGGVAQYLSYSLSDEWTLNGRAEVFADQHGAFVGVGQTSLDYANLQRGIFPANFSAYASGNGPGSGIIADSTYGEITLGASYRPSLFAGGYVTIRPELRYDTIVGGSKGAKPFDVNAAGFGTKTSQITLSVDAIVGF